MPIRIRGNTYCTPIRTQVLREQKLHEVVMNEAYWSLEVIWKAE